MRMWRDVLGIGEMDAVRTFMVEGKDLFIIEWLYKGMIISGVGLLLLQALSSFGRVPYGKYRNDSKWGNSTWGRFMVACKVHPPTGWFIQEATSLFIPLYLIWAFGGRYVGEFNPNMVLLGMYLLHYAHRLWSKMVELAYEQLVDCKYMRSLIYPFIQKGAPSPISFHIVATIFISLNGYMQGRYLINFAEYDSSWFFDPRFPVGLFMFLTGLAINIHSDALLRNLRKPGETGYKIPCGGMFEYVSGANYFGEALEWAGFFLACWNPVAFAYAFHTFCYLGPRALQHHKYYLEKFEDYPRNRRAFIPFIL